MLLEKSEAKSSESPLAQPMHTLTLGYPGKNGINHKRTVTIPFKHRSYILFQCIMRALTELSNVNPKRALKVMKEIDGLIKFIDKKYSNHKSIPTAILQIYSEYLNITQQLEPGSIRAKMTQLRFILEQIMNREWFQNLVVNDREYILSVYSHRPSIPRNVMTDGKFPALSELVISSQYDDLALLDSLVSFCLGFLNETQRLRETLLRDEYVQKALELTATSKCDVDWENFDSNPDLYDAIFNVLLSARDEVFIERLLYSNVRYADEFYTLSAPMALSQLQVRLKACVRKQGSLSRKNTKASEPDEYILFERLDARNLLSTCTTEEICLRWLLGTDRIQHSGQEKLKFEDFDISKTQLVINYTKQRSVRPERLSCIHKSKSAHYKIIAHHLELRQNFSSKLPQCDLNPEYFFQYESPFDRKQRFGSRTYGPIFFACHPSTHIYKIITDKYPNAKLFQKYFTQLGFQNDREKKGDDEAQTRGVTANIVAQSRAIVDPEKPSFRTPYERYARTKVEADAAAHSERVAESVYRIPSRTNHRLKKRSDFVSAAGEMQEEDARKLATLMSRTSIMTLEEVGEILGWRVSYYTSIDLENFNKLVVQAEAKGYQCTPFGAFTNDIDKERVIVKTPETVALIQSFIEGCKIELAASSTKERDHSMILNIAYAKLVLKEFDQRTISDGIKIYQDSDIPAAVV